MTWDDPNYRFGIERGYLPALASHGVTPLEIAYVKVPQDFASISDSSAAVASAVLKFQSRDIDHVIIQDGPAGVFDGTGLTLLFLNSANSQRYYPRYGFNTYNSPGWSILPAEQQRNALAVTWGQFDPKHDEGYRPNARREQCFDIVRAAGVPVTEQTYATAATACEIVWFVRDVLSRTTVLTAPGFVSAVESLGGVLPSAVVYGVRFGPGLRDGAALVRNSRFVDSCSCFEYTSAPYEPR